MAKISRASVPNEQSVPTSKKIEGRLYEINTATEKLLDESQRFIGFYCPRHLNNPLLVAQVAQIMATISVAII